eukprot:gene7655-9160_t
MEGTFHRRELKSPSVSFSSPEGRDIFKAALNEGHLEGYFHLAEHYITQGHPAFCGVGSLTMALNSLLLDPKRVWQGVWRWFDESMLDCCEPLDIIRLKGITLPKLSCLARCNGAKSTLKYGDSVTIDEFRADVLLVSTSPTANASTSEKAPSSSCVCSAQTAEVRLPNGTGCEQLSEEVAKDKQVNASVRNVMIASYSRRDLEQSGSGHFSPIGGYCAERDMVLIMDVARFKYPPHWVPLAALYQAMQRVDPETGKCRGYMLLSALPEMSHKCECASVCGESNGAGSVPEPCSLPADMAVTSAVTAPVAEFTSAESVVDDGNNINTPVASSTCTVDVTCSPATRLHTLLQHSCPNCK